MARMRISPRKQRRARAVTRMSTAIDSAAPTQRRLLVTAGVAGVLSSLVYPLAGVVVIYRAGIERSAAALSGILNSEAGWQFAIMTATPLLQTSVALVALAYGVSNQNRSEQLARLWAGIASVVGVFAFSLFTAQEALAAPVLQLTGSSTSALAFVFMPLYGGFVLGASFLPVWIFAHGLYRLRGRARRWVK